MDRGLLSDQAVIEASRAFVCIRTATYEDAAEAQFQRATLSGGRGDLRNFGYCLLSPDGKKAIRRSSRGPNYIYANAGAMAAELRKVAGRYPPKASANKSPKTLPQLKNVRLALNVASCDGLPLVVVVGKDAKKVAAMSKRLSAVAWRDDLLGKFIYAATPEAADLSGIDIASKGHGFYVIEPDDYGLAGELIRKLSATSSERDLTNALQSIAKAFDKPAKIHRQHVRQGRRAGKTWKTEVPVPKRRRR